jgi:hypothetical protein
MKLAQELAALFDRDLARLEQELRAFPDTETLWMVAPGVSNAAGTLALHLEGNLREYIGRQLGHHDYTRDRAREFSARGVPQQELLERVGALRGTIPAVIRDLAPEALAEAYPEPYNGAAITTQQFLVHLLSHFNYHLGQIDYLRRFTSGAGAIQLATL